MDRRSFIETLAALAATTTVDSGAPQMPAAGKIAGTFAGIQMGPHTIPDEGIERTLDVRPTIPTRSIVPPLLPSLPALTGLSCRESTKRWSWSIFGPWAERCGK
jgi:hypothetical protein